MLTVRRTEGPSSANPRPNMACSRRRHRRFTNIYSFLSLWRSIDARSAARLRRTVGPLSRHGACRTGTPITSLRHTIPKSPDITGHIRTEPDISGQPDIVGQKRVVACGRVWCRITCHKVGRVRKEPVPDRVPEGRSRAQGAGAGSCAVPSVAGARSRCRIACRTVGRGRTEPVPDRVPEGRSRAHGAGAEHGVGDGRRVRYRRSPDRVRYGPSLTHVPSHPGPPWRPHVSAVFTVGCAERPSSAMPRPNIACRRRR